MSQWGNNNELALQHGGFCTMWSLSPPHTWGKSWANCLARRFAQLFPHVCGEIVVRNSPREAVRIKSNMFDIFCLARQIPQCVRPSWESSWAWFYQAANKNTWHTHVTPAVHDGVGGRNSDVTEVTWECHVFLLDASLTKLNSILTMAAHNEEFASRGEKYQTCLIFSSRPREANFSRKVPRTRWENGWANSLARQFAQLFPHRVRRALVAKGLFRQLSLIDTSGTKKKKKNNTANWPAPNWVPSWLS